MPTALSYAPPAVPDTSDAATLRRFGRNVLRVCLALALAALLTGGYAYSRTRVQSAGRIEREHGLTLPPTAANFRCQGDAWKTAFSDGFARSDFDLPAADLPKFVAQLQRGGTNSPWAGDRFGVVGPNGTTYYDCLSPTGDFLTVWVTPLSPATVRVSLYTDWN